MPHSVVITTPMPTLDELGKELGLSRRVQDSLIRLVDSKGRGQKSTRSKHRAAPQRSVGVDLKRKQKSRASARA